MGEKDKHCKNEKYVINFNRVRVLLASLLRWQKDKQLNDLEMIYIMKECTKLMDIADKKKLKEAFEYTISESEKNVEKNKIATQMVR